MPDPQFTPVDHDPFTPTQFEPVDHDPFAVQLMTHYGPDPVAEDIGRRTRQVGQNLWNTWTAPYRITENLGRQTREGTLDPTNPETAGSGLELAAAITGGRMPFAKAGEFGATGGRGPVGAMPDWLKEESLNQPGVKVRNYPSGAVRVDEGTSQTGIRPTGKVGVIRANPDDMDDFRRMIAEGKSFSEIGEYLGISKGAVAGIKRREELKSKVKLESVDHDPFATEPLERQAITRGRSGRPIQTAPLPIGNENAVLEAGAKLNEPSPSITAFHGSPHDFDKFDLSRIGTGEGAQAYGHGLYFAENEGVAQQYRRNLSDRPDAPEATLVDANKRPINALDVPGELFNLRGAKSDVSYDDLINAAKKNIDWAASGKNAQLREANLKRANAAFDWLKANEGTHFTANPERGRMYQVSINADPEHFLDWDKPLSEQHPKVIEAVAKAHGAGEYRPLEQDLPRFKGMSGQEAIQGLAQKILAEKAHGGMPPGGFSGDMEASNALRAAGIPGIKYLDQGSRLTGGVDKLGDKYFVKGSMKPYDTRAEAEAAAVASGGATRNFVVFDDKLIDIMKKYGLAGLSALPAAGAYHFKAQQVDHDPFASQ